MNCSPSNFVNLYYTPGPTSHISFSVHYEELLYGAFTFTQSRKRGLIAEALPEKQIGEHIHSIVIGLIVSYACFFSYIQGCKG